MHVLDNVNFEKHWHSKEKKRKLENKSIQLSLCAMSAYTESAAKKRSKQNQNCLLNCLILVTQQALQNHNDACILNAET